MGYDSRKKEAPFNEARRSCGMSPVRRFAVIEEPDDAPPSRSVADPSKLAGLIVAASAKARGEK